jgi:hypothetical protein
MRLNVYVDGFNLYYGALRGTPYRWLDLGELSRRLFPSDNINRIRYFTARVAGRPTDPAASRRQTVYLRALNTIPNLQIHYGHFLAHPVRMPLAAAPRVGPRTVEVIKTEEKGSDVNLATYLLLDGFRGDYEAAAVVSNDSDLAEPIAVARVELGLVIGVVNPHPPAARSRVLAGSFFKQLRRGALLTSQFPEVISDARGTITKPRDW